MERWGELVNSAGQIVLQDGAFLTAPELFDAGFFHISLGEAKIMDMQQRLLLADAHTEACKYHVPCQRHMISLHHQPFHQKQT